MRATARKSFGDGEVREKMSHLCEMVERERWHVSWNHSHTCRDDRERKRNREEGRHLLRNRWVHFRIQDVYYPDAEKVLKDLHGNDLLQGRVVELTDNGGQDGAFAVVKVESIPAPVVIRVDRILGVM